MTILQIFILAPFFGSFRHQFFCLQSCLIFCVRFLEYRTVHLLPSIQYSTLNCHLNTYDILYFQKWSVRLIRFIYRQHILIFVDFANRKMECSVSKQVYFFPLIAGTTHHVLSGTGQTREKGDNAKPCILGGVVPSCRLDSLTSCPGRKGASRYREFHSLYRLICTCKQEYSTWPTRHRKLELIWAYNFLEEQSWGGRTG